MTYQAEGDAVTVDSTTGAVTAQKAGSAKVIAETAAKADVLDTIAANHIGSIPVWNFNGTDNPLSGTSLDSGRIFADKTVKVTNTDTDKKGTVVSGSFEIKEVAANIAFNAEGNSFYFWQFRKDNGTLKKHKQLNGTVSDFDSIPITLQEGENRFLIATVGKKIYTWLNDALVDVCDTQDSMPVSGGFGVRNGMSESFYINSISVGSGLLFRAETDVTVVADELPHIASVSPLDSIEVSVGTTFGELPLPETVTVTLSDGTSRESHVDWSGEYHASKAGTYTLTGMLATGADYTNQEAKTASVEITVKAQEPEKPFVISVEEFADKKVLLGTEFDSIPLPAAAEITLSDKRTVTAEITWKGGCDTTKAGKYTLTGILAAGEDYENDRNIQAVINIIVVEKQEVKKPQITSVQIFEDIKVTEGTAFEQLDLPGTAEVTLSDNTKRR